MWKLYLSLAAVNFAATILFLPYAAADSLVAQAGMAVSLLTGAFFLALIQQPGRDNDG